MALITLPVYVGRDKETVRTDLPETGEGGSSLIDRWGRRLDYLRISVIDRCNLRCIYCMPKGTPVPWIPRPDLLTDEEIVRLVRVAVGLGVRKIRITGGEPLVRKDVVDLVRTLAGLPGIEDLALSTNGLLLDRHAGGLKEAGLMRLNVSLDTIDPARFREMTGGGDLVAVLSGIRAAVEAGLRSIKVNTVVIRGVNDGDLNALLDFAEREGVILRFIEYMPLCSRGIWTEGFISAREILDRIRDRLAPDAEMTATDMSEPARYFRLKNGRGKVGVISPISNHFCSNCNRLRLTADGMLRLCIASDIEIDLKTPLRLGATEHQIARLFTQGARLKPEQGEFDGANVRTMIQIGG